MTDTFPTQLLIGADWRDASDGEELDVYDPGTGEVIASIASGSPHDAVDAVTAASDALPGWAKTPPRERGELLRGAFEQMIARKDEIAELIVRENGKALPDAVGETTYAAEFFRWYAEEGVRLDGQITTSPSGGNKIITLHQPVGVSVLVTPWNFPAAMATRKIGPALAAGCTVILKPASDTPLTALLVAQILLDVGVPPGVVNVVPSKRSSKTVGAMLEDPRVRKLSFTGSTDVGRVLLRSAAEGVLNCGMELGGNAPFLIFDDADIDAAVDGAVIAKMRNGGESCIAANRFYVQSGIAAEFSKRLAEALGSFKMGYGLDPGVQVGPLISANARDEVDELVGASVDGGAKVLTGGSPGKGRGYFYPPTVLSDVAPDAPILDEEIFGPVAPIVSFDSEEEALRMANDSIYGLASYVYSQDLAKAMRVAEALEAGMVGVNRGFISDPAATFGGIKQSGIGREGGHEGLLDFTEAKYIAVDW